MFQTNLEHWCLPEGAVVDNANMIVTVGPGHTEAEAIQAPYSLQLQFVLFSLKKVDWPGDLIHLRKAPKREQSVRNTLKIYV